MRVVAGCTIASTVETAVLPRAAFWCLPQAGRMEVGGGWDGMGWDGTGTGTDTDTDAGRSDPEGREREGGGAHPPRSCFGGLRFCLLSSAQLRACRCYYRCCTLSNPSLRWSRWLPLSVQPQPYLLSPPQHRAVGSPPEVSCVCTVSANGRGANEAIRRYLGRHDQAPGRVSASLRHHAVGFVGRCGSCLTVCLFDCLAVWRVLCFVVLRFLCVLRFVFCEDALVCEKCASGWSCSQPRVDSPASNMATRTTKQLTTRSGPRC